MLVFFTFLPAGMLLGALAGAILFGLQAREPRMPAAGEPPLER
jgi:hypothetical protein